MAGMKGRSGGQNRKSTHQLKADGGYRRDRHGRRVDQMVAPATLTPPDHLSDIGRAAWIRITGSLDPSLITDLDVDSLTAFCDCLEAYSGIRPKYLAAPTDKDARIAFYAALDRMDKLGRQFGWSPQSRAGIQAPGDDSEGSVFESLLARMNNSN